MNLVSSISKRALVAPVAVRRRRAMDTALRALLRSRRLFPKLSQTKSQMLYQMVNKMT